jgi:hypothetical protein
MKRFIQICSLLSLLVLFTGASASANTGFGSEVEIPFAFTVGDRSYDAGNYIIKFDRLSSGTSTLTIQDAKSGDMQTVLIHVNSGNPGNQVKLVFDTIEGKKYLTKIQTVGRAYAVAGSKVDRKAAKSGIAEKTSSGAAISGGSDLF